MMRQNRNSRRHTNLPRTRIELCKPLAAYLMSEGDDETNQGGGATLRALSDRIGSKLYPPEPAALEDCDQTPSVWVSTHIVFRFPSQSSIRGPLRSGAMRSNRYATMDCRENRSIERVSSSSVHAVRDRS